MKTPPAATGGGKRTDRTASPCRPAVGKQQRIGRGAHIRISPSIPISARRTCLTAKPAAPAYTDNHTQFVGQVIGQKKLTGAHATTATRSALCDNGCSKRSTAAATATTAP